MFWRNVAQEHNYKIVCLLGSHKERRGGEDLCTLLYVVTNDVYFHLNFGLKFEWFQNIIKKLLMD